MVHYAGLTPSRDRAADPGHAVGEVIREGFPSRNDSQTRVVDVASDWRVVVDPADVDGCWLLLGCGSRPMRPVGASGRRVLDVSCWAEVCLLRLLELESFRVSPFVAGFPGS